MKARAAAPTWGTRQAIRNGQVGLRYWIVMYLVMTAAMLSGIYISGRLLISHETTLIQTAMGMQPDQPGNK